MDQINQQQASNLEYNSSSDSYSDIESNYSLGADLLPPPSPNPSLPSDSITSTSNSKHTIGARIQAITYL
jgi:hypothetical protein